MFRLVLSSLAIMSAACGPAARAAEPVVSAPSSKWILDYGETRCRLLRTFGEGDRQVTFYLERFGPGDRFGMLVAGKPFESIEQGDRVAVRFGPVESSQHPSFFPGKFGEAGAALVFGSLQITAPESEGLKGRALRKFQDGLPLDFEEPEVSTLQEQAVSWVSIGHGKNLDIQLQTGSMGEPFAALRTCVDNLVKSWGVDPVQDKTLSRRVVPTESPAKWITSEDYPGMALRRGMQALMQFRLSVDAQGRPTACKIQQSTSAEEFDRAVCGSLMKRAKFQPALNADGQAVPSYYRTSVQFTLPR